ncbi:uncharacterized protein LOC120325812 isoform X3 [Styela clava]
MHNVYIIELGATVDCMIQCSFSSKISRMKNSILISVWIVTFACVNAACNHGETQLGQGCLHTTKTDSMTFTQFHHVGQKWNSGPCLECSCDPVTYETYLNCTLPVQNALPTTKETKTYFINLENIHPTSCPFGFTTVTDKNKDERSEVFVVYRIVDSVAWSCCNNMENPTIPDECEAILLPNGCQHEFVLKADNSLPCPGPVSAVG